MSRRILVVEDNLDNMRLVTWILEDEGYDVTGAATAEECLELVDQQPFDLIFMDISLPGMDGKDATRILRSKDAFKSLPIVALTAHAVKGEDDEIRASGVDDLITKPLDEDFLIDYLEKLFSN